MSGSSSFRPGYQAMLEAARRREFDVLVAEALDRISRDQEDIAALFMTLKFAGIRIITRAEGEVNELHVGLKGTMNALFLKDLALKTHRGLRGRAEAGKSAGGRCYGYRPLRSLRSDGELSRGDREIVEAEAVVIRRIFQMFAEGQSPIAIAKALNGEGVPGPQGQAWRDTTIRGHALRGTGLLRNELYVGRQVWNRMKFMKDPATGKRISRMNPASDWVVQDLPELRIVPADLWDAVQQRLNDIREASGANKPDRVPFWEKRRARTLLTGKLVCGECGGAFAAVGKDLLACTAARRQGTCGNRAGIRRPILDGLILDALKARLMDPDLVALFISEFTQEWNRTQAESSAQLASRQRELDGVQRRLAGLIDAIADGLRAPGLQQKLDDLERRKAELERELAAPVKPQIALHPRLAELYRAKVRDLGRALEDKVEGTAALEAVRCLIDRVVLSPALDGKGLEIELIGEIASMIDMALERKSGSKPGSAAADRNLFMRSVKVVAGIGNHREFIPMSVAC